MKRKNRISFNVMTVSWPHWQSEHKHAKNIQYLTFIQTNWKLIWSSFQIVDTQKNKKAVLKSLTCSVIHVYISLFLGRNTIKTGTIRYAVVDNYGNWNITVNYFWLWPSLFLGRIFHWKVLEAQNYFFNQSAEHSNVQITWLKRWCSDQIIHDRRLLHDYWNE